METKKKIRIKETVQKNRMPSELEELGEFDTCKITKSRGKQWVKYLTSLYRQDFKTGSGKDIKKTNIGESYERQKIVEVYDRLWPEGTQHIEEEQEEGLM